MAINQAVARWLVFPVDAAAVGGELGAADAERHARNGAAFVRGDLFISGAADWLWNNGRYAVSSSKKKRNTLVCCASNYPLYWLIDLFSAVFHSRMGWLVSVIGIRYTVFRDAFLDSCQCQNKVSIYGAVY